MALIKDVLNDWSLEQHEIDRAVRGYKCLFLVPDDYPEISTFYHTNGYSFRALETFEKAFEEFSENDAKEFGCKLGIIEASCEHPEFVEYYYGNKIISGTRGAIHALSIYMKEFRPDLLGKTHKFVKTMYRPYQNGHSTERTKENTDSSSHLGMYW